jgi:hypothetical protein
VPQRVIDPFNTILFPSSKNKLVENLSRPEQMTAKDSTSRGLDSRPMKTRIRYQYGDARSAVSITQDRRHLAPQRKYNGMNLSIFSPTQPPRLGGAKIGWIPEAVASTRSDDLDLSHPSVPFLRTYSTYSE